jgi:regulator of sirC expression with transglutaminase-like and TPR domain
MNARSSTDSLPQPSASRRAALVNLLADEDPAIYQEVRRTILACGADAEEWLRPHLLDDDPLLRRRAREIIRHFGLQAADIRFLAFCLQHGEEFDLETGAWLLARTEYPDINLAAYRALLDDFAVALRERVHPKDPPDQVVCAINEYLFEEQGFTGNTRDYHDPDNNYLNRVLDRRTGNSVALCLLYLLLARRLRLPVAGIGLPGHFICRYQSTSDEVYIDVFHQGRLLTKADCIHYLVQGNHSFREDFLAPASARRLLRCLCRNLHQLYLQIERPDEATRLQRYLVALKG